MLAGRARPLPLRDAARSTSRVHARLTVDGWKVLLSDDASANGTFLSRSGAAGPWLPVTAQIPVALLSTATGCAWASASCCSTPGGRRSSPRLPGEGGPMDRVADYVFLRELGRGEHSQVYLARTPRRLGIATDTVAVKVLSLPGTDGFDALADELSLFAALRAPQLVPMYDVGTDGGVVFYAMRHEPSGRWPHRPGT